MTVKNRADLIAAALRKKYPDAVCSLNYGKDYELLFSTRLAAQCTDARVNIVTVELFRRYASLEDFASADLAELESIVRPCGFFHTKAGDIRDCAAMLLSDFGGRVPDAMESLLTLPGVGRKTANIILGDIYGKPAVVTDTHCIRLANRMGLCGTRDPYKVELALGTLIDPPEQTMFCHRLVYHGRDTCAARKPLCRDCAVSGLCPKII